MNDPTITEAELAEAYAKTSLAKAGCPLDRALEIECVRIALAGSIKANRKVAARRAQDSAIQHQVQEAA